VIKFSYDFTRVSYPGSDPTYTLKRINEGRNESSYINQHHSLCDDDVISVGHSLRPSLVESSHNYFIDSTRWRTHLCQTTDRRSDPTNLGNKYRKLHETRNETDSNSKFVRPTRARRETLLEQSFHANVDVTAPTRFATFMTTSNTMIHV